MKQDVNFRSIRTPGRSIAIGRVTVFLGANGTGKSKLLNELAVHAPSVFPGYTVVRIEGGRAITLTDSLALDRRTFDSYRNLTTAKQTHKNKIASTLSSRVFDALQVLERMGRSIKAEHSDEVIRWQAQKAEGPCPKREQPPLERVFELFNEIFPRIELSYDESTQGMSCKKGESTYPPSQLSDGEKQCFSILADLVELAEDLSTVIIDEPELNLNPLLAVRLWDTIEAEFPEAIFIYATHSVSFAMRRNVNRVHVLSDNDGTIQEIDVIGDVTTEELPPLLGSIPAILTTKTAIVTEGNEKSFDGVFYKWLVPNVEFEPVPVGGGNDVAAVAARHGVWEAISANFKLIGVVDRDYKSDDEIEVLRASCAVLDWHEAESYLCDPGLLSALAASLGTAEPIPTVDAIHAIIKEYVSERSLQICAKRIFSRLTHRIGVSARRRVCSALANYKDLQNIIRTEVQSELDKTGAIFDINRIDQIFEEERQRCVVAVTSDNIDLLLTMAPGKELLEKLAPSVGCKNALAVVRAAKKHLDFNTYPKLLSLSQTLTTRLT